MASASHTYGPTCALYEDDHDDSSRGPTDNPNPPKVRAQFFYISALPIDDPLSPLPPIPDAKTSQTKAPPQPFSVKDNNALEEAWQGLRSGKTSRPSSSKAQPSGKRLGEIFHFPGLSRKGTKDKITKETTQNLLVDSDDDDTGLSDSLKEASRDALMRKELKQERKSAKAEAKAEKTSQKASKVDALQALREEVEATTSDTTTSKFQAPSQPSPRPSSRQTQGEESHVLLADAPEHHEKPSDYFLSSSLDLKSSSGSNERSRSRSPFRSKWKDRKGALPEESASSASVNQADGPSELASSVDMHTSGNPFARAPSYNGSRMAVSFDGARDNSTNVANQTRSEASGRPRSRASGQRDRNPDRSNSRPWSRANDPSQELAATQNAYIPVGIARLHLVELPELMMKPIYWSPVHDVARVMRATWFYKNTMSPVESHVANRLELGYEDFRPWTETWQDELNSCVDHGPEAELKITRRLWPEDEKEKASRPGTSAEMKAVDDRELAEEEPEELPQHHENRAAAPITKSKPSRLFSSHSVIYVDGRNAQLLRPSLAPSPSRKRTALGAIRKGRQIGIAVVRGFDRKAWDTIHPPKKMDAQTANAKVGAYMSQSGDATTQGRRLSCTACKMNEQKPPVTDLVLVIHGIGQKLSERMETFHFTHAINGFRRQVNIELVSEAVRGNLREDMGGIMVLPINWRLTLSFDAEGRPIDEDPKTDPTKNEYTLKDITPDTLPAIRSLISDVMLDIPYYLSHHKDTMISAVVKEANRVYRLWCRNNPGFHESGRVHVIAHSLGSAMSMDILSQQPTTVPRSLDLKNPVSDKVFEFNTSSLFCCGSPAGFFLLLHRANLLPRKGRNKPGFEGEDEGRGVAGAAGTYGCPAVDNIYNVMHYNDPIAYHMNAAVDVEYAHMLKPGNIPSASSGWFSSLNNAFRWGSSGSSTMVTTPGGRPTLPKLPTTVELNIHDFSREDIVEKRMHLLNDNGQIDYFLSSGGGPLEIQYLNMLSAHSSYWVLQDFVRFIVMEIGRSPGREGTIPALRAEKKRIIKAGKLS